MGYQARNKPNNDTTIQTTKGNDTLHGGQGADLFHLSSGRDTILDFRPQQGDRIHLRSAPTLQIMQQKKDLLILDPSQNIHTSLLNTSLNALIHAHPELYTWSLTLPSTANADNEAYEESSKEEIQTGMRLISSNSNA